MVFPFKIKKPAEAAGWVEYEILKLSAGEPLA
jgi:hypothetical protein